METRIKPHIVHIINSSFAAKFFLRGQLRFLREQGYEVTLIAPPGPELVWIQQQEGANIVPCPMRREPSPFLDLVALGRLTSLLWSLRPDLVHYSTPKAALLGGFAATLSRVPRQVMTLHGIRSDGLSQPLRSAILSMEKISCAAACRIYCVSDSLRSRAIALRLTPKHKLKVIGCGSTNGVQTDQFSRNPEVLQQAEELRARWQMDPETLVIGFVGRLVQDKGIVELIAAFDQLKSQVAGLKLLLVGPFEEYDGLLAELRAKIENDPQIIHLGYLEDPVPAYALMDVLALPSYREGFPNVILEAAAMELPVVATSVTGCVDAVVDGHTGMLVPVRDANSLANAIGHYLDDPVLRHTHGQAGRLRVQEDYQPEAIWRSLAQEYAELLQR